MMGFYCFVDLSSCKTWGYMELKKERFSIVYWIFLEQNDPMSGERC